MTQIAVSGVAVQFGATRLFSDVTFTVVRGERWGIVGRNGTGKTTLFRLLTGEQEPSAGTVARATGVRFSVMEQHREFPGASTVWEAAAGGSADLLDLERSLGEQATALAEAGDALHAPDARALRSRPRALRAGRRLHADRRASTPCFMAWASILTRRAPERSRA